MVVAEENGAVSIVSAMQRHPDHLKLQMYGCAAIANVTFGGMFYLIFDQRLFVLKVVQA
jgi:hypothetical protein